MKKILIAILVAMLVASNAHAITWTKNWSSSDDGSPLSGSDIQDIQNDVNTQAVTLTGNQTISGSNTFSGTTTFSGTIVGITGSAAHAITRGFELVWKSTTLVTVNAGTLFHGTTAVTKTTNTDLDITAIGDAIDGAAVQGVNKWVYIYCDSSGNLKLYATAPDKADTSGNTSGTKIYYYYGATTTYYRCLGAIRLNATGAGEIEKFYQSNSKFTYDEVYGNAIVRVLNAGASVAYADMDCSSAVPSISTICDVIYVPSATQTLNLRVKGSSSTNGSMAWQNTDTYYKVIGDIPLSSSQVAQYKVDAGNATIYVKGYEINIR